MAQVIDYKDSRKLSDSWNVQCRDARAWFGRILFSSSQATENPHDNNMTKETWKPPEMMVNVAQQDGQKCGEEAEGRPKRLRNSDNYFHFFFTYFFQNTWHRFLTVTCSAKSSERCVAVDFEGPCLLWKRESYLPSGLPASFLIGQWLCKPENWRQGTAGAWKC